MDKKTLDEYSQPIQHTVEYLEGKRNRSPRRGWTDDQRKKWSLRHRSCPICGESWTKNNIMTKEHIHPLVLGGFERDENIIPLCNKCNKARNDVMIAVLGSSDLKAIRKRMPAINGPIQEFVVWCHATISKDYTALEQTKHLTQSFLKLRKIENPFSDEVTDSGSVRKRHHGTESFIKRGLNFGRTLLAQRSKKSRSFEPEQKVRGLLQKTRLCPTNESPG